MEPRQWSDEDSLLYANIAPVAVPARAEQLAALLTLLPFSPADFFHAVDLGSGEGFLGHALLDAFPRARVTALDGSEVMRARTEKRLDGFGGRASVRPLELESTAWVDDLRAVDCVLSSLVIHHLDHDRKRRLFHTVYELLEERAALLIADVVEPQRSEARGLWAAQWDRAAELQSVAVAGSDRLYRDFLEARWNLYEHPDPDLDHPSPLYDQLGWLQEANFTGVDCFWLQAGHAIYGGYKGVDPGAHGLEFAAALSAAERALQAQA